MYVLLPTFPPLSPLFSAFPFQMEYGVVTISTLRKIIGLFCKTALKKRRDSAQETYHSKEPTNRSHSMGEVGSLK